jgi:carbon-monoxide dehydrogenase medium subunit
VALALDAELVVQGPQGQRTVAATGFFTGFLQTALGEQDVLREIRLRPTGRAGWAFQKFTRRAQDWATVGVAVVLDGRTAVALVNMGPTPLRARAVEETGDPDAAAEGTAPPSDSNSSAEFRRQLARVLTRRTLEEARSRAS